MQKTTSKLPPKKQRIVVMSAPFGGGHAAAVEAIREILGKRPDVEVVELDAISEADPEFARNMSSLYESSSEKSGGVWFKVYYLVTDHFPIILRWYAVMKFKKYAEKKWLDLQPDLVIATFPFLGHLAALAREKNNSRAPIITVITDSGDVQGIWLCGREDKMLVADPETINYAVKRGISRDRLDYVGLPLRGKFEKKLDREKVREKLGFKESDRVALMMTGAKGLNGDKMVKIAKSLKDSGLDWKYIFVCGSNQDLYSKIQDLELKNSLVLGFVDNIEEYYAACDVACTKAGWLTISEVLALHKPLIISSVTPGHEEQNVKYLQNHGYGELCDTPEKLIDFLNDCDDVKLAKYSARLADIDDIETVNARFKRYIITLLG